MINSLLSISHQEDVAHWSRHPRGLIDVRLEIQVQIVSSGCGQTTSYPDLSQPSQDWKMAVHGSSPTYTRTLTADSYENNECIAEVEPEEMEYTASHEQPSFAYYGRACVPDEA
ncbi:uncharacterized protein EAE98_007156 [Botrytis deweyae]|uniref:Uncharacterized protein n=1 Tax=Botrytis deweyae TaxID=2478750 RepID=A0ABQ7II84_9HELO|nr:uncharacterized protein EAE98_007156 [Botrytis deweyae]KAF7925068.1 hypothetical protein EAE98_007156 [Botrytis deweyae]